MGALQAVDGDAQTGEAGSLLARSLVVKVADSKGRVLPGVSVSWSIESGGGTVQATSVTSAAGLASTSWTLGTVAGAAAVRATAGDVSTRFTATITPGVVASLALAPATLTLDPGAQRQLQATAADAYGNQVTGRTAAWETSEPLVATVDNSGLVRGVAGGIATIRATVDTRAATSTVTVTGPPAPIPTITTIAPDPLTPGATATITGTNFAASAAGNSVSINGASAAVTSASATQLQVTVPAATQLGCLPLTTVNVVVSVGSARATRPHPLKTATPRSLATGDVLFSTPGAPLGCTELAAGSGRYLVAVYNTGPGFLGSGQSYVNPGPGIQVRTAVASSASGALAGTPAAAAAPVSPLGPVAPDRLLGHLRLHEQLMAANARVAERIHVPARRQFPGSAALTSAVAAVGDSLWLRFPDVSKESSATCSQFDSVRARVAYVGTRAIVLEDVTAPLAGQVDSMYQRLADQFDQVQYPIIRDNFGDPLVLDSRLNNDGHLYMLFTRRVNGLYNGRILGFVWSGDFDDGTFCRQSNRAEIFYGIVPTVLTGGGSNDWELGDWYDYTRATVIHEVKHVASMGARQNNLQSPFGADSMWLEEAGAMVAEELWGRQLFHYQQGGNTGFDQSILCELNLQGSGCTGMPIVMLNHFAFLYDYFDRADSLSFLGRTVDGDATFYGSGWAFLRWLTDQSGMPEAQFLSQLTHASTAGLTSVQALTGRSYEDLFREFVLASALDDRAGFTPTNPRLSQPSWNMRDVFGGMSRLRTTSGGVPFPSPFPFASRSLAPPGSTVSQVRPGGAVLFEFTVPGTGAQAFDVAAADGGVLPSGLRVALVRVQ